MADLLIDPYKRKQENGTGQIKNGIGIGNAAGVNGMLPYTVQQPGPVNNHNHSQGQDGFAQIE